MSDKNNVTAAKPKVGGGLYAAPVGTELPTSASATLATAFKNLGYASEDGVSNDNSRSTESIKEWGGDEVLVVQEGLEDTFKLTLIEATNIDALKTIFGSDNVSGTLDTGISVKVNNDEIEAQTYVIDMILKNGNLKRIVIPEGYITALDTINYKRNEPVSYGVTIRATANSDGDYHYEYITKKTNG